MMLVLVLVAAEAKIKSVRTVSEQILGQQLRVNPDNLGAALISKPIIFLLTLLLFILILLLSSFSSSFFCSPSSFSSSFFENPSLPSPPLHSRTPKAAFLPILAPILLLPALPAHRMGCYGHPKGNQLLPV